MHTGNVISKAPCRGGERVLGAAELPLGNGSSLRMNQQILAPT